MNKLLIFAFALLFGLQAQAQCNLTTTTDATSKTNLTKTQDEQVVNTAGRKWVYYMTKTQDGGHTLHLKYNQTDMIFAVPKTAQLQLTTTDGSTIAVPVKFGAEGEGRHFKGVKYWTVTLDFPLSGEQLAQLQTSDIKTMQLDLTKGQANMAVPEKKQQVFKNLANCIAQ